MIDSHQYPHCWDSIPITFPVDIPIDIPYDRWAQPGIHVGSTYSKVEDSMEVPDWRPKRSHGALATVGAPEGGFTHHM